MNDFVKILPYSVDLDQTIEKTPLPTLFATEDSLAHCFELTIHRSGEAVDLTGAEVTGYFIRHSDRETVRIKGDIKDSTAVLTLEEACYLLAGKFTLTIKIKLGEVRMAVFFGEGGMTRSRTDVIVDKDRKVIGVEELLALIDEIEQAAEDAKDAVKVAEAWANATTSVTTLAPGSEATVTVQDVDGVRQIAFGIPQGIQGPQGPIGPTGATGPQGPAGNDGSDGADGKDFTVKGLYGTIEALQEAHTTGSVGDAYAVGTSESNVVYIWDVDAGAWANLGALQGPEGPQGPAGPQGPEGPQGPAGPAGTDGADGKNGTDGKTPVRGTDYWTEDDRAKIVSDVLAALPTWEGGAY